MNNTISYATTVWNEHVELDRLLTQLMAIIGPDDEIVIQGDQGKVTDRVVSVLHKHHRNPQIKYIEYPLKRNFAAFKNNLFKNCEKSYIVNIDADEVMHPHLAANIRNVIAANPDIDMFRLPRVNIVEDITDEYMRQMGWRSNPDGWINYPDYQCRIVRNADTIRWINSVHEILAGYKTVTDFPAEYQWSLIHVKSADRQIQQNLFYSSF